MFIIKSLKKMPRTFLLMQYKVFKTSYVFVQLWILYCLSNHFELINQ